VQFGLKVAEAETCFATMRMRKRSDKACSGEGMLIWNSHSCSRTRKRIQISNLIVECKNEDNLIWVVVTSVQVARDDTQNLGRVI